MEGGGVGHPSQHFFWRWGNIRRLYRHSFLTPFSFVFYHLFPLEKAWLHKAIVSLNSLPPKLRFLFAGHKLACTDVCDSFFQHRITGVTHAWDNDLLCMWIVFVPYSAIAQDPVCTSPKIFYYHHMIIIEFLPLCITLETSRMLSIMGRA